MQKTLTLILLAFLSTLAVAQGEASHPPSPTVDMVYVVIFIVLFFGAIGGFFLFVWMNERKKKQGQ